MLAHAFLLFMIHEKGSFILMTDLFSPYSFKSLELKNRVVMAPMCQYSVEQKMVLQQIGIICTTLVVPWEEQVSLSLK